MRSWKNGRGVGFLKRLILATALALTAPTSYSGDVTLEVKPAELKFDTQAEQKALVILRNGGDAELGDVRLHSLAPANFSVSASPAEKVTLPAGADAAWQLDIRQSDTSGGSDEVLLRVEYSVANAQATVHRTLTGSLKVVGPVLPAADALLAVSADSTIESLTEKTPGRLYLSVQNKSRYPIEIGDITSQNEFMEIEILSKPPVIQVSETAVVTLSLKSIKAVNPGKYLVVVNVPFTWTQGNRSFSASAVSKKEIAVGVFGESEILKLLGIPSFLVLPGFLFVTTLGLLWKLKLFRKDAGDSKFALQPSTPEFWLVAITVSMIMAYLYPRLNWGNDYLLGYELNDVVKVWTISIFGFGLLGYTLVAVIAKIISAARARHAMKSIIAVTDEPIVVLGKLDKVGSGIQPGRATFTEAGEQAYIYQRSAAGQDGLIVGPLLALTWKDSADDDARQLADDILAAPGNDAATRLAELLGKTDASTFDLEWTKSGTLTGLRMVASDKLLSPIAPSPIAVVQIT